MNILSRLFKVLGSRLPHSDKPSRYKKKEDRGRDPRSPSEKNVNTETSDREYQMDIDPVLARYYANLELPYGADLEQVSKAWKRLMSTYHPDLHSTDPEKRRIANELCQGLNRAYEGLVGYLETINSNK
jgi:hypothetical protein